AVMADRRVRRVLLRLREDPSVGGRLSGGLRPVGPVLCLPEMEPRKLLSADSRLPVRGLRPKPRSGGEPDARRAPESARPVRGTEACCGSNSAFALHTSGLYGRGVWGNGAVPVFC